MKAFNNIDGFTHILSFQSQMFIHPETVLEILDLLQINYEDTSYCILRCLILT